MTRSRGGFLSDINFARKMWQLVSLSLGVWIILFNGSIFSNAKNSTKYGFCQYTISNNPITYDIAPSLVSLPIMASLQCPRICVLCNSFSDLFFHYIDDIITILFTSKEDKKLFFHTQIIFPDIIRIIIFQQKTGLSFLYNTSIQLCISRALAWQWQNLQNLLVEKGHVMSWTNKIAERANR